MILAVDPGLRGCGCALFTLNGSLAAVDYVSGSAAPLERSVAAASTARSVWRWVCRLTPLSTAELVLEWPQVYYARIRAGGARTDPNDLLGLAAVDGALVAASPRARVTHYLPAEWKGQQNKEACRARIRSRLDAREMGLLDIVKPASKAHNAWDAVGIGLHHLGRLGRRRA